MIWLSYYLKSDIHPEPKSIILEVFILGMISGGAAMGLQYALNYLGSADKTILAFVAAFPVIMVAGWAFIEEYVKYAVVKIRILHDVAFDEPTDAMIYMISAGLGFAAIENILFVLPEIFKGVDQAIYFLFLRFITATLLHALASGIIGFFFALAIIYHARIILFLGFIFGVGLHTIYNYSIMVSDWGYGNYVLPLILFLGIIFIKIAFFRLRNKRF
ncbi:hypothetical protein A2907_01410 [Candidatus Azambacteria bacterium RIFCSPLOWO2_01_FULL_37_9]|uniref:Protease PrsW n=1 Tax=Candidatus Azambacteria bacterium RIFCSPLOWO2_01_FULL_37_9 TaxID=1797297 RepID=A0A1F5C7E2_9BACT|nr:MAG: hypothetical protein A2907_01410 [Candidatus Azambacteria bacterium RIFCSPLOWO2_01_FULL_37_9]